MLNDIILNESSDNDSNNRSQDQRSLQNQIKRQREWVYLVHYLAIQGLDPIHIISGMDDGHEPDFTLIFWEHNQLVYIGVELTTLPRLRTQMSEHGLIAKRWYWQSLLIAAKQQLVGRAHDADEGGYYSKNCTLNNYHFSHISHIDNNRFKLPMRTVYMPQQQFVAHAQAMSISYITQEDVDAVMKKKKRKTQAYQTRRSLNELWLLIHTDKYQPDRLLTASKDNQTGQECVLQHDSAFNKVHITRYPSYKVIDVKTI